MYVQVIQMVWAPGTGAPDQIDYMIGQGTLLKDGQVVATLPNTGIHMINVDSLIAWDLPQEYEADQIHIELYDVDYPHTLYINGAEFAIPEGNGVWQTFTFDLPDSVDQTPPPSEDSPTNLLTTALPALIIMPMLAALPKMMR